MAYLTICLHSLHLGAMSFMLYLGKSTVYRTVVVWAGFIETFLSQLNIEPSQGYLLKNMTDVFVKARYGMADWLLSVQNSISACHKLRFEYSYILKLQKTVTGKALIGISPHGAGLLFSDGFPRSVSDSTLTEKSSVLDCV